MNPSDPKESNDTIGQLTTTRGAVMSSTSATDSIQRHPLAFRRFLARHPLATFLALVYVIYTAIALVPPLTDHAFPYDMPLWVAVGHLFGVAVPAVVVTWLADGREGVRDLARRCTRWRVAPRWYVASLFAMPAAFLLLAIVAIGDGPLDLLGDHWARMFTNVLPYLALSILLFNVAEEIGWTGFFHARVQERYTALKACAVVAFPFALFHVPDFLVDEGWSVANIGPALAFLVFYTFILFFLRVVLVWLYNNTGGSVLIVGFFHSSFNTAVTRMSVDFLPSKAAGFLLMISITIVAAVVTIVRTRGRLGYDRLQAGGAGGSQGRHRASGLPDPGAFTSAPPERRTPSRSSHG